MPKRDSIDNKVEKKNVIKPILKVPLKKEKINTSVKKKSSRESVPLCNFGNRIVNVDETVTKLSKSADIDCKENKRELETIHPDILPLHGNNYRIPEQVTVRDKNELGTQGSKMILESESPEFYYRFLPCDAFILDHDTKAFSNILSRNPPALLIRKYETQSNTPKTLACRSSSWSTPRKINKYKRIDFMSKRNKKTPEMARLFIGQRTSYNVGTIFARNKLDTTSKTPLRSIQTEQSVKDKSSKENVGPHPSTMVESAKSQSVKSLVSKFEILSRSNCKEHKIHLVPRNKIITFPCFTDNSPSLFEEHKHSSSGSNCNATKSTSPDRQNSEEHTDSILDETRNYACKSLLYEISKAVDDITKESEECSGNVLENCASLSKMEQPAEPLPNPDLISVVTADHEEQNPDNDVLRLFSIPEIKLQYKECDVEPVAVDYEDYENTKETNIETSSTNSKKINKFFIKVYEDDLDVMVYSTNEKLHFILKDEDFPPLEPPENNTVFVD